MFSPISAVVAIALAGPVGKAEDGMGVPLPEGVEAVWDLGKAFRETTPTRERICLNGLWRWKPAGTSLEEVPTRGWGYFKVPGCWPGITDYMQKDSQTVFVHSDWKETRLASVGAAWYEREFTVPDGWAGRQMSLELAHLNSHATVYVDGMRVGEARFPAGEVDLTSACRPGGKHQLSLLVVALPMKGVMLSYTDSASAREVKGSVPRRGICGDAFLVSRPSATRLGEVKVETSVRHEQIRIRAAIRNPAPEVRYTLRVRIRNDTDLVKELSRPVRAGDLADGEIDVIEKWKPEALWDTHTPRHIHLLEVSLLDDAGQVLDVHEPLRFGFRQLWIDGRDFVLNGSRIHLSAVPLDNAQISAAAATYAAARETFERLQSFGINFVYTHNYDCEPGAHLGFEEILRAADDTGMLVSMTQPHFSGYEWKAERAEETNGYAGHAAFYTRVAGSHPSVVMFSMSHNATGYEEDMNPDLIDGKHDPRDTWSARNAKLALRAEAIVKNLDPSRIVYHHASGNLGSMHVMNFYPNMVPIQELSDWFGHWATEGVKPAFMCEFGAPFTWDWTMYRGWYKGEREFGSAKVPWEFCLAEWNAQFLGDRAYAISEAEKANLRWEARQYHAGSLWHRWDYPNQVGSDRFTERYPILAMYLEATWRAFRTWGVSAISPWEYGHFWRRREPANRAREQLKVDWQNLQRPGFSPDFVDERLERMDVAFGRNDWVATPAAEALIRNNRPLLAYIAGKPASFTSKDHLFRAGEAIEKQIIVINDSRQSVTCECHWSLRLPEPIIGMRMVTVPAGGQERVPLRFELPALVPRGRYELVGRFDFSTGETQTDRFAIDVMASARAVEVGAKMAVFDPLGETRRMLESLNVKFATVDADADLSPFDLALVGKGALTVDNEGPDISRVRDGLRVIIFEQTPEVMERRFGFRTASYGLRQVFARVPDHPVLRGLDADGLRDWRGESTIVPPRLSYHLRPRYGPTVRWCGLQVPRLWRCGNRGNVASVLLERPPRGDFLSILDGAFGLHFSSLLECREGQGVVVFCQTDVTGRTEPDPAADTLIRNLLEYLNAWKPGPMRHAVYAGESAGRRHFEVTGVPVSDYDGRKLSVDDVLVLGPGAGRVIAGDANQITDWLATGGSLLAIGLDEEDAAVLGSLRVTLKRREHIAAYFEPPHRASLLAGVGPADVHTRDPREIPLVTGGAEVLGDGVLATAATMNAVFVQLAPWRFEAAGPSNLRRTHHRTAVLVSRALANMGVLSATPILDRCHLPVQRTGADQRWIEGLYLDAPEEWDDPYRFFRW